MVIFSIIENNILTYDMPRGSCLCGKITYEAEIPLDDSLKVIFMYLAMTSANFAASFAKPISAIVECVVKSPERLLASISIF